MRRRALGAGVEQGEAAGAVSRFHHAGLEAALPDRRRLLVAGDAEHADGAAEQLRRGDAEFAGAVAHLRQHCHRHAEQFAKAGVPGAPADVEQRGARRVGGVGRVHLAAGQPPQKECVDGAEGELAGLRRGARAGHIVEQPGDLAGGKIRIEQQSGLGRDLRLVPALAQRLAQWRGAAILPDNRVVNRLAGGALPDHRGLALIGDADAGDVAGR